MFADRMRVQRQARTAPPTSPSFDLTGSRGQSEVGPDGGPLSFGLASRIRAQQGAGAPLHASVQQRMEGAFGHNFSDVRIHADSESDTLNRHLSANAFTVGSDVFLGAQAASKEDNGGDALLAHELSHVIQQRGADQEGPLSVDAVDAPGEQEATAIPHALRGAQMPAQSLTAGPARVQREPVAKSGRETEVGGVQTRLDTLERADQDRKKQDEIRDKKVAALALDRLWRAKFGERMASYKQAVWRITAGIDMAKQGFEQAQIAQAQTDQLATQLFGVTASFLFAGAFEWLAGTTLKGLGLLSTKISGTVRNVEAKAGTALPPGAQTVSLPLPPLPPQKWSTGSIIETVENPMNALVGGYMTNIRGAQKQQEVTGTVARDVAKAEQASEKGQGADGPGGSAVGVLARKSEALEHHSQGIEQAFIDRAQLLDALSDDGWVKLDVGAQGQTYQKLLDELNASASGVEKMETVEYVANIIEKYMWADWILHSADRQSGGMLHNFGTDIDLRLIKIGVETQADVIARKAGSEFGLSEHWWQSSTDNWRGYIQKWAREYKGSIAK